MTKDYSPFTPGSPVPVELFVGRSQQLNEVLRYIRQSLSGKQENIFLIGDRGIGKSSFASFIRRLAADQENVLGIHVFLGKVNTLEGMVQSIFDQLLKETKSQSWFSSFSTLFGKYIKEVGLFGISVDFTPPKEELTELVRHFPETLYNILEKIKDEKQGLLMILDDINGLAESKEFANWYKSFVDEVATRYTAFPITILLIGLPEKRQLLSTHQPSLMRIYRIIEIEKLSDDEVRNFITNAFEKVSMKLNTDALDALIRYSSGLPILMHEIGDATFWNDDDGIIDLIDAIDGISLAAERVGQKYLDPKVYSALRSDRYRSIMQKLGELPLMMRQNFIKKDVEIKLSEKEKNVFHNFLSKLQKLGIVKQDVEKGRGAYRFVNEIYPIYIMMKSKQIKQKQSG